MHKISLLRFTQRLILTLIVAIPAWAQDSATPREQLIIRGFATETPPGATVGAAYLTLHNRGDTARSLRAIALPHHPRATASLHTTEQREGVSRMRAIDAIQVPARGQLEMRPGGLHVMLHGVALKAGETLALQLIFADGETLALTLPIKSPLADRQHYHHG